MAGAGWGLVGWAYWLAPQSWRAGGGGGGGAVGTEQLVAARN